MSQIVMFKKYDGRINTIILAARYINYNFYTDTNLVFVQSSFSVNSMILSI